MSKHIDNQSCGTVNSKKGCSSNKFFLILDDNEVEDPGVVGNASYLNHNQVDSSLSYIEQNSICPNEKTIDDGTTLIEIISMQ